MTEYLDASDGLDRRVFVKGLGFVGMGLVLSLFGGCERFCEQIRNRPTRRRLRTGSAEVDAAVATYRKAVAAMKALPAGDARSWTAQAAIHGTVAGGFNLCQHGTDHFFSWHRAYLFYFEKICQELTGDRTFGLPYWNWNQNPAIHPEFTAAASPLFHPRSSTTVAGNPAFSNATLDTIFADTNFFTFGSQVEGTPHNTAHVQVGMDMASGGSAIDPVFWAHHCMVDYCWAKWNIEMDNDNTNDGGWLGTSWNHFVDGQGNPVNVTAGATILMPLLAYQYETSAIGGALARARLTTEELRRIETRLRAGIDVRFQITRRVLIAERASVSIARPFSTEKTVPVQELAPILDADKARERVFVRVAFGHPPAANDFFVRVFVALPPAGPQTPTDDPHYAGSFAFFGTQSEHHAAHPHKLDFLVNVTDTLQRLRRSGELAADKPFSLQLVAVPAAKELARPDAELVLEQLELVVSPVLVRERPR
jgi:tyrosinase